MRVEACQHPQKANGCARLLGPSGYPNVCTTVKSGAVRFERDVIDRDTDQPATVYLNVLAGAKPLLAEKVEESDRVALGSVPEGLTVARYGTASGGVIYRLRASAPR